MIHNINSRGGNDLYIGGGGADIFQVQFEGQFALRDMWRSRSSCKRGLDSVDFRCFWHARIHVSRYVRNYPGHNCLKKWDYFQ